MENKHDVFIEALKCSQLVELTFNSKQKGTLTRTCVPLDYGPWKRSSSSTDRYHFYSVSSPGGAHNLSIKPDQICDLIMTEDTFDPEEIVTWEPQWHVERDWGAKS